MRLGLVLVVVGALVAGFGCARQDAPGSTATIDDGSQSPADALLERAIAFHDPEGRWAAGRFELLIDESRPDGPTRRSEVALDLGADRYEIRTERDGHQVELVIYPDEVVARLDGRDDFTPEDAEKFGLAGAAALRTRNYYLYLYGLPMKLRDPGAILRPEVVDTEFQGRAVRELRVSYDPEVGSDVWYFYFAPEDAQLVGYRFFHDEAKGDGETITLEGLAEVGGLRLPRVRTWYTNQDHRLLGTDTLVVPE